MTMIYQFMSKTTIPVLRIFLLAVTAQIFLSPSLLFAQEASDIATTTADVSEIDREERSGTLPMARVFFRKDGGVSITYFVTGYCVGGETILQCMDRLTQSFPEKNLDYEDVSLADIPRDRSTRDKWRGEKGKGIWVDEKLVTKADKVKEYTEALDAELDKDTPDASKVLKLQRLVERVRDFPNPVLSEDDLKTLEPKKEKNIVATVIGGIGDFIGDVFEGIKNGILAIASVVTNSLKVGSSEAPAGITVFDQATGEANCVVVKNGKLETIPGECGVPREGNQEVTEKSTNKAPVITINGANPSRIQIGASYVDLGAIVTDDKDDNLGLRYFVDGVHANEISLDTASSTTYLIEYVATDTDGNTATSSRTVIVSDSQNGKTEVPEDEIVIDETAPTLTILGQTDLEILEGDVYEDMGATAEDDVDGNITDKIITVSSVNPDKAGTYHVDYEVSDKAGNKASPLIRTVTVAKKTKKASDVLPGSETTSTSTEPAPDNE